MKLYFVSKTLLGSTPDRNRRRIVEAEAGPDGKPVFSTEKTVCVINDTMEPWTADHMRWQEAILQGLRDRENVNATDVR